MRSRSLLPLLVAAAALFSVASVACQAPVDDDSSVSEGKLATPARKGEEFTRCWTVSDGNADDFFRRYALSCRVSSKGLEGLSGSSVFVDVMTAGGRVVSGRPGETPDSDVLIGNVSKSDFPLSVRVYGTWASAPNESLTSYRVTVPAAETANASAPVIVKVPFDTWPVTILNRLPFVVVSTSRYDVQAAPFFTEQDERSTKTTFTTSATTGVLRGPRADLAVLAPPSGHLDVQIQGGQGTQHATIASPGVYVVDEAGLHLATAAEEADAGIGAADEDGGTTNEDGSAPDEDAAPPVSTTCGNNGQASCLSSGVRSCNPGTRYDSYRGVCVSCGAAGQTYCFVDPNNVSGAQSCNGGTRYDSYRNACVACGAAGQTYCFVDPNNFSGAQSCNDGTRYDSYRNACVACGAAGQTYCFDDPNNVSGAQSCDAGLHVSSNGTCVN
jgi:hypothetical protein